MTSQNIRKNFFSRRGHFLLLKEYLQIMSISSRMQGMHLQVNKKKQLQKKKNKKKREKRMQ